MTRIVRRGKGIVDSKIEADILKKEGKGWEKMKEKPRKMSTQRKKKTPGKPRYKGS